jgi:hypothetical protein
MIFALTYKRNANLAKGGKQCAGTGSGLLSGVREAATGAAANTICEIITGAGLSVAPEFAYF